MSEDGGKAEQTPEAKDIIKKLKSEFEAKMLDDLNTAHILTGAYQDALKFINASLSKLKVFASCLFLYLCLLAFTTIHTKVVWCFQFFRKCRRSSEYRCLFHSLRLRKLQGKYLMS